MRQDLNKPSLDGTVRKMALICGVGFGGFLLWGSLAPLEEGVAASGQIVIEDNRQVVQHLEGGLVSEILIREGQTVQKGDVLIVLQKTASLSNRDQVVQEYGALSASVARQKALRDNKASPDFSALDSLELGEIEKADIIRREAGLFLQQKNALLADVSVLSARVQAAINTQASRTRQIIIAEKALSAAEQELTTLRDIFSQQLARRDQVTAAERLVANLEGDIARLLSEKEDATSSQRDFQAQIAQTRARAAQENATNLLSTSGDLLAVDGKPRVSKAK